MPSPPNLAVTAVDLETYKFSISPPQMAEDCVVNYTITSTSSDGMMSNIVVDADELTLMEEG